MVCGQCPNCRQGKKHLYSHAKGLGVNCLGCLAKYFVLPAEDVFVLPDSIFDEQAAIFDPYGNAVHTALSFDLAGEDVLIYRGRSDWHHGSSCGTSSGSALRSDDGFE